MRWLPRLSVATRLRIGFALAALLLAALLGSVVETLPYVLLVLTLDLAATVLLASPGGASRLRRMQALALICAAAVSSGVAMAYGGLGPSRSSSSRPFTPGCASADWGRCGWLAGGCHGLRCHRLRPRTERGGEQPHAAVVVRRRRGRAARALSRRIETAEAAAAVDPSLAAEASMLLRRLHELADSRHRLRRPCLGGDGPAGPCRAHALGPQRHPRRVWLRPCGAAASAAPTARRGRTLPNRDRCCGRPERGLADADQLGRRPRRAVRDRRAPAGRDRQADGSAGGGPPAVTPFSRRTSRPPRRSRRSLRAHRPVRGVRQPA